MEVIKERVKIVGKNQIRQDEEQEVIPFSSLGTIYIHEQAIFLTFEMEDASGKHDIRMKLAKDKQSAEIVRRNNMGELKLPLVLGKDQTFTYALAGVGQLALQSRLNALEVEGDEGQGRVVCQYDLSDPYKKAIGKYQLELQYWREVV